MHCHPNALRYFSFILKKSKNKNANIYSHANIYYKVR